MPVSYRDSYVYTVNQGDTLYSIAQRFRSSIQEIALVNHLFPPVTDAGLIYPGNVLVMPTTVRKGKVFYVVNPGDYLNRVAHRFHTSSDLLSGINNLVNPNVIYPLQQLRVPAFLYEIEMGDTLARISRKLGIPIVSIIKANEGRPGFQPDLIWPGFYLIMPLPTSRNIVVWSPLPGTRMAGGQRIAGQARAFEANVLHQLRDANGVVVSNERFTTADIGAPAYGNFSSVVPFDRSPTTNVGELWVYTRSAMDGSIQDLVRTNVFYD